MEQIFCRYSVTVLIMIALYSFSSSDAFAQSGDNACISHYKDIPISSLVVSAGVFDNMLNRAGSIKFESNAIFHRAKALADVLTNPSNFCPNGCAMAKKVVMYFRSVPEKVLAEYSDADYCQNLLKATLKQPLNYENALIETIDDLNKWIGDLSQGKGSFGADLYKHCDRSCSPRYEYTITKNKESAGPKNYTVRASVVCGPARDKGNGMYALDSFFRWSCEKE